MRVMIEVDISETDTIRGYHDRSGHVIFHFPSHPHSNEWQESIVKSIIGQGWNMWESVTHAPIAGDPHRWSVRYGYDSGD